MPGPLLAFVVPLGQGRGTCSGQSLPAPSLLWAERQPCSTIKLMTEAEAGLQLGTGDDGPPHPVTGSFLAPQVSAPFRIEVAPDVLVKDQAFSCPTAHGIVPPGEKKFVSVFFRPETLDVRTMDYLSIVPSGCASQTLLKVVGFSRGTGSPRSLHCLQGQQQPLLTTDQRLLLDAWGLFTLSLGVCCPLVGSARNQLRSPGDTVGILTPRLPDSQPSPSNRHPSTTRPGGLHRPLGRQAFPTQSSVSKQHHIPSVGPLETQPGGSLTATPPPPPPPPGPDLSLQHRCVDFSWVSLGTRSEQRLWMENKSDCRAYFHFDIDCPESVFSIRPAFGTLWARPA